MLSCSLHNGFLEITIHHSAGRVNCKNQAKDNRNFLYVFSLIPNYLLADVGLIDMEDYGFTR